MNARNSSDSDDGVGAAGTTPRVSAKMRFLATPPSMMPSSSYDYGNNDNHRVVVRKQPSLSKGGINGSSVVDDDGDAGGGNGRGHASLVKGALGRQQQQQQMSHRSSRSDVPVNVDRPWRTSSSSTSSSTATASYATARSADYDNEEDAIEFSVGGMGMGVGVGMGTGMGGGGVATTTLSPSSRWSQYETDDLEEESRRATSNAVVDVATRLANSMGGSAVSAGGEEDVGFLLSSSRAEEEGRRTTAIMGGVAGTGYGYGGAGGGDLSSSEMSTTDYVKSRLSSLLMNNKARDGDYNTSSYGAQSDHDKVRNEALKMLHLADSCLQDSPHSPRTGGGSNNNNNSATTTALFRTTGGGLAMREMQQDEVEAVKRRGIASIAGLDRFGSGSGYDRKGAFTIGSHDEDDVAASSVTGGRRGGGGGGDDSNNDPNEDTPSLWSSRYSVERQLMAITGGLDSAHMLAKMDMLHSSREKTKSARGMYRSSGHAVDGSHVEYGDYTKNSSSPGMAGFGMDRLWLYVRGTLWSDDPELNYDGTTQSLVRREKAMRRRRRVRCGLLFLAALCVAVGVLVRMGNPKSSGNVNFYVLSDEPYEFSNIVQLTRDLQAVPDDADFVVHLGNVNGDAQTMCREYGFERAAAVLGESPVPVLIVPGDLDWAACGSEESASKSLGWWKAYLGRLEDRWDHGLEVEHDDAVIGNFAFLRKGVLFVGISMIDGVTSPGEVTSRLERNVLWTKDKLVRYDAGGKKKDGRGYHAVVIFGHAPPSDIQGEYFWPMLEQFKKIDKPVLYLHANKSGSFERYTPYDEAENFSAVQLEKRGVEAPMKVVVMGQDGKRRDKGAGVDLFVFERRESNLERQEE